MSIPRFGMTRPVPVNLLMAAILIGGVASAITLTREFFPDTTPDSALVTLRSRFRSTRRAMPGAKPPSSPTLVLWPASCKAPLSV